MLSNDLHTEMSLSSSTDVSLILPAKIYSSQSHGRMFAQYATAGENLLAVIIVRGFLKFMGLPEKIRKKNIACITSRGRAWNA